MKHGLCCSNIPKPPRRQLDASTNASPLLPPTLALAHFDPARLARSATPSHPWSVAENHSPFVLPQIVPAAPPATKPNRAVSLSTPADIPEISRWVSWFPVIGKLAELCNVSAPNIVTWRTSDVPPPGAHVANTQRAPATRMIAHDRMMTDPVVGANPGRV